jgi:hypothetical protein
MKKDLLLKRLKEEGANERTLSECGLNYIIHNVSDEFAVGGYAVIKVEEGTLLIPYGEVLPHEADGYEQFYVDKAKLIDKEAIETIYEELLLKLNYFKNTFMNDIEGK